MTAAISMGNPSARQINGPAAPARRKPQRRPARRATTYTSTTGSGLLTLAVWFLLMAFIAPKAHAIFLEWQIPMAVAEDVQSVLRDTSLFRAGCGHPPPNVAQVARSVAITKTNPWGQQYSLAVGGKNSLWVCLGSVPATHKKGVEKILRDQKRVVSESEGLMYVMCVF